MTAEGIAKVTWDDPETAERREYVLIEGATASIGRSTTNDIVIPQRHVSRQHAVITFRDGIFMISDLGSANGTFVNDRRLTDPFPLAHGDTIRLYVPVLAFSAIVSDEDQEIARKTGTLIIPASEGQARLLVTVGVQEGAEYLLMDEHVTIGRATQGAAWEIGLQDRAVSRPHCRLSRHNKTWSILDLDSANGTLVNGASVSTQTPLTLKDGDVLTIGETTMLFRSMAPTARIDRPDA